jgi:excisionase family DNA binding protein
MPKPFGNHGDLLQAEYINGASPDRDRSRGQEGVEENAAIQAALTRPGGSSYQIVTLLGPSPGKTAIPSRCPFPSGRTTNQRGRRPRPQEKVLEGQVERIAYRKSEAAEMLGLCLRTIDNMIADKELISRKFGRRVVIPATAVYALMGCSSPKAGKVLRIAYTKNEAAWALGLSVRTIDNLIGAKELKSTKVRGRVLILVTSLYALVRCDHKTARAAA